MHILPVAMKQKQERGVVGYTLVHFVIQGGVIIADVTILPG
jgi:hypothetical protein